MSFINMQYGLLHRVSQINIKSPPRFSILLHHHHQKRELKVFPFLHIIRMKNLVFLAIFFFTFYNNLSESESYNHSGGHQKKKLPSAIVVGTVYCDTCFHQDFSKSSHFISGATVAVECRDSSTNSSRLNFRQLVKTNEHGEFKVHLPFSVSKHVRKIKACSVKLIRSSEPFCAVASTATSASLRLKSRKEGTHIFSAGFFTFKPLKQPEVCDQKPSIKNTRKNLNVAAADSSISDPNNPAFLPPIRDPPPSSDLPSLPNLPNLPDLPLLPPLPVPEIPYIPPVPTKKPSKEESTKTSELTDKKTVQLQQRRPSGFFPFPLPPNPLLPPPSLIPPVLPAPPPSLFPPIFPSPPPSIIPPIFPSPPSPPPSIFPPLIPFPGLNPPQPPPPRPPSFPIPLPPGFPGVPPASEPKNNHP